MSETYFRIQTADRDPADLLDPEHQISGHWSNIESMDRPGVSVCASREDLARYLAGAGIPFGVGEWVLVELRGERSDVADYDAAFGALLVHPTEIVAVAPLDDEFYDLVGAAYDAMVA
ncbi:hypothetical protein ABZS66_19305 [Dactylosporangium sp. NPDC005572]|uniref:hypothetical protein n=1 Tax=Dactylosporangium sp. NPDC005572 TaxID=3156889 RepID=UPI0033B1B1B0